MHGLSGRPGCARVKRQSTGPAGEPAAGSKRPMTSAGPGRDEILTVRGVRVHLLGGGGVPWGGGGGGEPLLYLHGAGTTNVWLPFHAQLAARCQLYAPDLLG